METIETKRRHFSFRLLCISFRIYFYIGGNYNIKWFAKLTSESSQYDGYIYMNMIEDKGGSTYYP